MKKLYSNEFNIWQRLFAKLTTMWRINKDSIDFKWGYFAPRFGFQLMLNRGGYFNPRYSISMCFIWGAFNIALPFKTRLSEGCSLPKYGIQIHGGTFWLHYGGKYDNSFGQVTGDSWWTWGLPFFTWNFEGHWMKGLDNEWVKMGDGIKSWTFKEDHALQYDADFEYELNSGEVQHRTALFCEEKRQWGRKWFPFLKMVNHGIDIDFNDEVGERSGSWKGGTVGCSYEMLPSETPQECFKRMMAEREFK